MSQIRDEFTQERMNSIKILRQESNTSNYVAALDDNDEIVYIGNRKLEGGDFDYIWFNSQGFDVEFDTKDEYRCGYTPFGRTGTKKDEEVCQTDFTSVDSLGMEVFGRIYYGVMTYGVGLVLAGNTHTRVFDDGYFRASIVDSNLDELQDDIVTHKDLNSKREFVYEVVEIDDYNIDDDINSITSPCEYDGVMFVDDKNGELYGVYDYDDYRSKNYSVAINKIISDLYTNIAKNKNITITKEMIEDKIPPKIKKPSIPPPDKLVKSEYEKESEFRDRVQRAAKAREEKIKALQEKYDSEVEARNEYITKLEDMYQKQFDEQKQRREKLIESIDANMESLSKFLFTRYMNGFEVKNANYDAEKEELYFTLVSNSNTYKNMVKASLPPNAAKKIKESGVYDIKPELEYEDDTLYVSGFEIESDGSEYEIVYTDRSFEPTKMVVTVANRSERIEQGRQLDFSSYKQAQVDLIDYSKSEQWFVDVVSRDSAKVPEWFKNIQLSSGLYGFGVGDSLDEATEVAIGSLARHMSANIKSSSSIKREASNSNQLYSEYEREIDVQSDIILKKDDYKLYRQDLYDGKWYVVVESINN
jgi:hypothetical protein